MTAPVRFPPALRDALPGSVVGAARAGRRGYRLATSPLRPLPHFLLIGAQKAGTTSLYDAIAQHPRVVHALGKGVHYFDAAGRGAAWYRSNFPVVLRPGRDDPARAPFLTGEASQEYLPHPWPPPASPRWCPVSASWRCCATPWTGPSPTTTTAARWAPRACRCARRWPAKRSAWPASWRGSRRTRAPTASRCATTPT